MTKLKLSSTNVVVTFINQRLAFVKLYIVKINTHNCWINMVKTSDSKKCNLKHFKNTLTSTFGNDSSL